MLNVSFAGALVAGLLSFVSPCVLPIVPPYLAWIAGVSFEDLQVNEPLSVQRRRVVMSAVAFVLGFTTVFMMLGATATAVGRAITQYFDVLSVVAGAIIIVMGLHFLGLLRLSLFYRDARFKVERKPEGLFGAYLVGLAFAFGWTPCAGPVLAAILFVAGGQDTVGRGILLLLLYSLGIGVPFVLSALFVSRFLGWAARFRTHLRKVEIAMGGFLVLTGVLFVTGQMSAISNWLLETFPVFQTIG